MQKRPNRLNKPKKRIFFAFLAPYGAHKKRNDFDSISIVQTKSKIKPSLAEIAGKGRGALRGNVL
jgi:hypothetical protein